VGEITAPAPLRSEHLCANFDCGNGTLNEWLVKRAFKNQSAGSSRTFVVCEGELVIGYYALATGSVERSLVASSFARNMPDPIPVIVLGRLAIDVKHQGRHIGAALLKDALSRVLAVSEHVGVRGMLVHAISEGAKHFYQQYGFQETPMESMTLVLSIKELKKRMQNVTTR